MISCDYIESYIGYMAEHPDWINRDRKLLIANVTEPTLRRDDIFLNDQQLKNCIRYCEANYYSLFPYQRFIISHLFLYKKEDGEPVFPEFLIMEGRGNGKDGLIAPVANFFQTPMYGVQGYNVDIVANSEDPAKNTYMVVYNKLYKNAKFAGKFRTTLEKCTNLATHSTLRYNTSKATTKYGKQTGMVVFNELHTYENYDQISVFTSGLGKIKNPRIITITTSGYVRGGPLDDKLLEAHKVLHGAENLTGLFPFICRLDDKAEADDMTAMHKANPSMEFMPILESQIKLDYIKAKAQPKLWPEYITMRCNLPENPPEMEAVASQQDILRCSYVGKTAEELEARTPRPVPDTAGQPAIIALDYADIRDFASVGILTKTDDDAYVWKQHSWLNKRNPRWGEIHFPAEQYWGTLGFTDYDVIDEPAIPIEPICDEIERLMTLYDVKKITLDMYRWTLIRPLFEARGWYEETKQNPGGIVRLIRRVSSISTIIGPFIQTLFAEGRIIYGDSAIMRWYTNNCGSKIDSNGNVVFFKLEERTLKTDGFFAFDIAMYSKDLLEEVV